MKRAAILACVSLGVAVFGAGAALAAVPTAPANVSATPGNTRATIHWRAVTATPAVASYTATAAPGGAHCTVAAPAVSCAITGLANGTTYSVTVTATNGDGTSPASSPAVSVTPATVPGAPTAAHASAGNTQATVTWTAPASNGGATIARYVVAASGTGGQTCTWTTGTLTCTVNGLINGLSYTFTVTAQNSAGDGPASAESNSVTPTGAPPPPTNVIATAGDQQATISCTTPITNGGATITSYTATASPGGAHASGKTCSGIVVTGLTDGTAYTFTVTATNSLGTSAPSAASAKVTPVDTHAPAAPSGVIGRIASGSMVLSWGAATDNVGVVRYEVSLNGKPLVSVTTTTATFRAFEPRGNSVYTVTAFDAAGNQSPVSAPVTAHPTPMPKSVPRNVPQWTWKLLAWQLHHKGVRPKTPAPLPKWYAAWKHWRTTPFELVS